MSDSSNACAKSPESVASSEPLSLSHPQDKYICEVLELIKLIYKKVDAIEDHLIKLDVRIANLEAGKPVQRSVAALPLEIIDLDQLAQFGLPVKSESELQQLEDKLNADKVFKTKLVNNKILKQVNFHFI